jgi:hypothetical protein
MVRGKEAKMEIPLRYSVMGQPEDSQVSSADNVPAFMTFQSKDPTAPLRFVPARTPPPFEAKSVVLKRTDPIRLDRLGHRAMSLFSSFVVDYWEKNKASWVEESTQMLASLSPQGGRYEVRTDARPNRRFSGDGFLSTSRYYSLCQSADGRDGGTMKRELIAYHNPWTAGVLDVRDLTDRSAEGAQLFCSVAPEMVTDPRLALLISIPPFTATQHEWLYDAAKRWGTTHVELPLSVTQVRFQRLVDLRVPRVAEWFTQNLTRLSWVSDDGTETPAFPNKPPLDEFVDLLPTLAVQCLGGGNGATRIAGQWLRSLGADGLVYPSARSNSFVEVRDGDVTAFHGWNLVDYRGADPARLLTFDLTPAWVEQVLNEVDEPPMALYGDVALEQNRSGRGEGSWSWQNLEQANLAQHLLFSAVKLYSWARDDASAAQLHELELMLGAEDLADTAAQTSAAFVLALLGNVKARRALLESVPEGLSPKEAHLVDLAGTFNRMDARIAAGKAGKFGESCSGPEHAGRGR